MIKFDIKLSEAFKAKVGRLKEEIGAVVASIVEEEFIEMLYRTPQWSGNYVANMKVSVGRQESKKFDPVFPVPKNGGQAVMAGSFAGISYAMGQNSGLVAKVRNYVKGSRAIFPSIIIYNNTPYAEKAESYERRFTGTEAALTRTDAAIRARFAGTIHYGTAEWKARAYGGGLL